MERFLANTLKVGVPCFGCLASSRGQCPHGFGKTRARLSDQASQVKITGNALSIRSGVIEVDSCRRVVSKNPGWNKFISFGYLKELYNVSRKTGYCVASLGVRPEI